nr:PREDICTED: uncharacterized protein LOC107398256 isoform X2 [Tribolium castaneum]|eukprot:XP_015837236.1 PREDICTED: uncharacterized protein LOC107398256 isoform X2 [Tribolium castaneum]
MVEGQHSITVHDSIQYFNYFILWCKTSENKKLMVIILSVIVKHSFFCSIGGRISFFTGNFLQADPEQRVREWHTHPRANISEISSLNLACTLVMLPCITEALSAANAIIFLYHFRPELALNIHLL